MTDKQILQQCFLIALRDKGLEGQAAIDWALMQSQAFEAFCKYSANGDKRLATIMIATREAIGLIARTGKIRQPITLSALKTVIKANHADFSPEELVTATDMAKNEGWIYPQSEKEWGRGQHQPCYYIAPFLAEKENVWAKTQ